MEELLRRLLEVQAGLVDGSLIRDAIVPYSRDIYDSLKVRRVPDRILDLTIRRTCRVRAVISAPQIPQSDTPIGSRLSGGMQVATPMRLTYTLMVSSITR